MAGCHLPRLHTVEVSPVLAYCFHKAAQETGGGAPGPVVAARPTEENAGLGPRPPASLPSAGCSAPESLGVFPQEAPVGINSEGCDAPSGFFPGTPNI